MNYAKIKPVDVANGTGVRVSLFVSGCSHRCKGCFNPELWNYNAGREFDDIDMAQIFDMCDKPYIRGLTLLGGEPLDPKNVPTVTYLARMFKYKFPNKDLWCYTGYDITDVYDLEIIKHIDVLVDGEFIEELKDPRLRFRGSSNQRIIDVKKTLRCGCICLRSDLM